MVSRNMPLKKIKIKIDPKNPYQVSVIKLSECYECIMLFCESRIYIWHK